MNGENKLTREGGLSGRYSPEREQREIPGSVWIDRAGLGTGSCLAETVQGEAEIDSRSFSGMFSRNRTS